jgi:serine/threonine protein kinase
MLRLLGRGDAGSVWEATRADGGPVALKFMTCGDGQEASAQIRAIQAIRELRHPNLVRVHQVWCQRKHLVLSMELANGTLADVRKGRQLETGQLLDPELVCRYLSQAANVLDFLNARQHTVGGRKVAFQHGDVRPSNLLLFGATVKLSDFGLASQTATPLPSQRRCAATGYAAPEVVQGRLSDTADQYALAVTYCELRTGQLPFPLEAVPGLGLPQQRSDPDLTVLDAPEQPLIARALARQPQDRWPSCRELIAKLARVAV